MAPEIFPCVPPGGHREIALCVVIRFCLAALMAGGLAGVVRGQNAIPSFSAAMTPVLKDFDGQSMPQLRTAYFNWSTNVILTELRRCKQTVPDDCLAELAGDADLRDAMFRSVYPPDPSVLQNYARLRQELGAAFVSNYHSLVIALAVARRIRGVEMSASQDGLFWHSQFLDGVGGAEGNYQPGFWTDESLQGAGSPAEKEFVAALADFMKANQITALDLYTNQVSRERLASALKDRGISNSLVGELNQGVQFGERLKNAMVLLGQRPGAREKKPDEKQWLHYLATGYWQTVEQFAARFAILERPPPQTEADLTRLGGFLRTVPGINGDDLKSYTAKFYQQRAESGDAVGELRMGERYQDGVGVPKDEERAKYYFAKAAARGNADARRELRILSATISASDITVTVSSQGSADQDMHHLIDGAGMCGGLHDNDHSARTMWHTVSHPNAQPPAEGLAPSPAWARFDFAAPETLWSILIWNLNQSRLTDRDFHKARIYGTSDGSHWFPPDPRGDY